MRGYKLSCRVFRIASSALPHPLPRSAPHRLGATGKPQPLPTRTTTPVSPSCAFRACAVLLCTCASGLCAWASPLTTRACGAWRCERACALRAAWMAWREAWGRHTHGSTCPLRVVDFYGKLGVRPEHNHENRTNYNRLLFLDSLISVGLFSLHTTPSWKVGVLSSC